MFFVSLSYLTGAIIVSLSRKNSIILLYFNIANYILNYFINLYNCIDRKKKKIKESIKICFKV